MKPALEEVKKEVPSNFEDFNAPLVKQKEAEVDNNLKEEDKTVTSKIEEEKTKEKSVHEKIKLNGAEVEIELVKKQEGLNGSSPKKRMVITPTTSRPNLKTRDIGSARKLRKTDLMNGKFTPRNEVDWNEIHSWFKKINQYNSENKTVDNEEGKLPTSQEERKETVERRTSVAESRKESTPVAKEFVRTEVDESEDTFIVKMVIENKSNETCHLEFPYNPSKDSPAIVAKEMVVALSLDEVDIPRIQDAIQKEIAGQQAVNATSETTAEVSDNSNTHGNEEGEMKEHIEAVVKYVDESLKGEEAEMEAAEGMEELNKAFMLEIFKLAKRYRKKQQEFLSKGIIN